MSKRLSSGPADISTVLVTGGAGYVGSALVGLLLVQGYSVRTIDNLSFGGDALLAYLAHPASEFQKGDICCSQDVETALNGVDAVVHLAAVVGEKACDRNPERAIEVNRTASEMLCEKALARGVKRFVFASTCSSYGKAEAGDSIMDEESPLNPLSLYAELKVAFERLLLGLKEDGFAPTCLRFATAYGLSGRPRFDLTINEFTRDLLLGRRLEIYGRQFWRPYCHVVDLARACVTVLQAEESVVANCAFNVGDTQENFRKGKLVELILAHIPQAEGLVSYVSREEDPRDYRVNCDRIKRELGFLVTKRVPDGIREIIFSIESGLVSNPDDTRFRNV
ncbi:MAG: NAD(P)-dependent oxidoreductase [Candidatus Zixiibacteriota bacterium]